MNNTLILRGGLLEVRLPDGSSALFGDGEVGVTLHVRDEAMFGRVLTARRHRHCRGLP